MSSILDVDKSPGLVKLFFIREKNPSNSIQKLFMMETVSTVIVNHIYYSMIQPPAII